MTDGGAARSHSPEGQSLSASAPALDWLQQTLPALLLWKLPAALLVASPLLSLTTPVRGGLWAGAFATMGLGCIRNALRCRRLHCYFTGPLFLALAALSLLHGTGGFSLGSNAWSWLGGSALIGGVGVPVLMERLWGKYAGG